MVDRGGRSVLILSVMLLLAASCGGESQTVANDESRTAQDDSSSTVASISNDDSSAEESSSLSTTAGSPTDRSSVTIGRPSGSSSSSSTTAGPSAGSSSTTTTSATPATNGGEPKMGSGPIDSGLQPFIDDAVGQLAASLSIPSSDITVQSARLVEWGDSSLGCPMPEMAYAQVVTAGSAIELIADVTTYWFHSGGTKGPFLCTSSLRVTV